MSFFKGDSPLALAEPWFFSNLIPVFRTVRGDHPIEGRLDRGFFTSGCRSHSNRSNALRQLPDPVTVDAVKSTFTGLK